MANQPPPSSVDESTVINAPPRRVWSAIVEAGHRARWWSYLELDPEVGGHFEERWAGRNGEPRITSGRVTDLVEPAILGLSWADDDWPTATDVEIHLQSDDDVTTTVRVRHAGWERLPDGDRLADEHREGWRTHLSNLRGYLME